ncbi:hypothetical protein Ssi03_25030 [Sphaerisporangium siamense]|nr:hypothetical protein Ssi03_25030 [Sphaerisporangium siamense]
MLPAHRRRGLARWIKANQTLLVRERFPAVRSVTVTVNGSNAPMLAVNRAVGYRFLRERLLVEARRGAGSAGPAGEAPGDRVGPPGDVPSESPRRSRTWTAPARAAGRGVQAPATGPGPYGGRRRPPGVTSPGTPLGAGGRPLMFPLRSVSPGWGV